MSFAVYQALRLLPHRVHIVVKSSDKTPAAIHKDAGRNAARRRND